MAWRFKEKCKTCLLIAEQSGDPMSPKSSDLYQLINSYHKGATSLKAISEKYTQIKYLGLTNHAKKHQALTEAQLVKNKVRKSTKKIELEIAKKKLHHTDRREKLLDWLMDQLESGNVKPTASAITAALKQEADIEAKQTDQAIEMQKLMNSYIATPLPVASVRNIGNGPAIEEGEILGSTEPTPSS